MKVKNISFIGGDMRIIYLIDLFSKENYNIKVFGFDNYKFNNKDITICKTLPQAILDSDIIIGPVPFSSSSEYLHTPFNTDQIKINDILELMSSKQILIGGRFDNELKILFEENNINAIDILSREEFAVLNAISTAEGAIQIAMEKSPYTLHNMDILVVGFGRIGKILCKVLNGLGANVYCEARKYSDIAWIKAYGYNPIHLNDLNKEIPKFSLFINTVPYLLFDKNRIMKMKEDAIFIDLASKPGGIDLQAAKEKGIETILALSLPGKVAPLTAATHIKETIDNIIKELI